MSKLKRYVSAYVPDMSTRQAEAVIAILESIVESLWTAYGDEINNTFQDPISPAHQANLDQTEIF